MVQKQQIIISYYRQGVSQREIAKTLGLNRKTVKSYTFRTRTVQTKDGSLIKGFSPAIRKKSMSR